MLSSFQLNYVVALMNQILDLISLNIYDRFRNKHLAGFINYSLLLILVIPISFKYYKNRKFTIIQVYYIISLFIIQSLDFTRRLYYDLHNISLPNIKYPDIILRALLPWIFELAYNSKYLPNYYKNIISLYVITSVMYSLGEYTFQPFHQPMTLQIITLDLIKLILEMFESHFVIELNLNQVFLTAQYFTYSLSELITLYYLAPNRKPNFSLNRTDTLLSSIFLFCEIGCMLLIRRFTAKFAKFKEIRLLVFETYSDLF